jgi:hypothetical protein
LLALIVVKHNLAAAVSCLILVKTDYYISKCCRRPSIFRLDLDCITRGDESIGITIYVVGSMLPSLPSAEVAVVVCHQVEALSDTTSAGLSIAWTPLHLVFF